MTEEIRRHFDSVGGENYEKQRWFKDKASREMFFQTKASIIFHLDNVKKALEIGPGTGTWSKILLNKADSLMLIDISKEQLEEAEKNLKSKKARFVCSDFLDFKTKEKFDLIFSIRAIEYMPLGKKIDKMKKLLKPKGKIFLITKNPARRWRVKLGKKVEKIHRNWISIGKIEESLNKKGFKARIYPAVFSMFPFPNSFLVRKINRFCHKRFYKSRIKRFMAPFVESYVVKARKSP